MELAVSLSQQQEQHGRPQRLIAHLQAFKSQGLTQMLVLPLLLIVAQTTERRQGRLCPCHRFKMSGTCSQLILNAIVAPVHMLSPVIQACEHRLDAPCHSRTVHLETIA